MGRGYESEQEKYFIGIEKSCKYKQKSWIVILYQTRITYKNFR